MILGFLAFALAADEPPCLDRAVASLRIDPNGYAVYRALDDPQAFGFWLDCDDPDFDVSSEVHESVHLLSGGSSTSQYDFYLVGGDRLTVPVIPTPARSGIVAGLRNDERDGYVKTYLTGRSGEQGLEVLLDELNAYAHGLTTETALAERGRKGDRQTGARDGLAHFQLYTLIYLKGLQTGSPKKFARLSGTHGELVAALWKQAEVALVASSPYPQLGIDDRWYLARTYHPKLLAALDAFVGARAWSSSIKAEALRNPPARPRPPEKRPGTTQSESNHQERFRANVRLGEDVYDYEERLPSRDVILVINGERASAGTWAEVEALGLPEQVLDALRESRPPE